ncbi:MATE family efflux transporter [Roseisolibacter sp. H3M3-2]|uniref:MATE family efflux transporter n=1 Tax=Roseisolibacter sp. H3M3-2 TaxID=3031323 RepID=UPI0023DBB14F|nr:MATE family efflux transporter [Roseisolibacter sp. H3M3-2]MDF1501606.1 MATE family efflux transporter [Roseisolibacter sp. H3M3-2]
MNSLPIAERDGGVSVAATGEHGALVRDPLPRVIRRVAIPAVASNLLMTVFLAADAFWVGRRLGATALAAVTASVFWVWMGIAVAEMVSIGLTAVAARRHGERRPADAARAAGDARVLTLALGVAAAVAGHAWLDGMFAAMRTPADVAAVGRVYLGRYLLAAPVLYGYFVVDATFRASGDTRTPFVILLASVALALVLDPLLILGLGGLPRLGIAGAATATVLTRSLAFAVGLVLLWRRGMIRVGAPRPDVMLRIARIGLPTASTGVLFSVVYVLVARTASTFGTPALAALGLGFRVESWLYMIGVGFGAAAAAVVGQNLGAGLTERARRAGWTMLAWASAPAVLVTTLELLVPESLAAAFTGDASVIAETARYLRIVAVSQLVVCAEVVLEGALGGAGATVAPMLASTSLTLARVPLAAWAAARWGVDGLWWVISLTATARGLAMMALWRWGRWQRNVV